MFQAPFPWFGGKSRAAPLIWPRLGQVANLVIPFYGSGAELFLCPDEQLPGLITVNDKDAFLANVWRAMQAEPEKLADMCSWPVNEADLHARHLWLLQHRDDLTAHVMGDPFFYDLQIAAWWLWGVCVWIGSGWCSGEGPWHSVNGRLVKLESDGEGVKRQLVHLGSAGQGVHRQLVHNGGLLPWFQALQARLRYVRVCCGDYTRMLGYSVTVNHGLTAIIFDPPYAEDEERDMHIYRVDDGQVAHAVRDWCLHNGHNPLLRIILCGYAGTHDDLLNYGWTTAHWKPNGGMGNQVDGRGRLNKERETLWFSPHCLSPEPDQYNLFP